jgi:hypothetical protein
MSINNNFRVTAFEVRQQSASLNVSWNKTRSEISRLQVRQTSEVSGYSTTQMENQKCALFHSHRKSGDRSLQHLVPLYHDF